MCIAGLPNLEARIITSVSNVEQLQGGTIPPPGFLASPLERLAIMPKKQFPEPPYRCANQANIRSMTERKKIFQAASAGRIGIQCFRYVVVTSACCRLSSVADDHTGTFFPKDTSLPFLGARASVSALLSAQEAEHPGGL